MEGLSALEDKTYMIDRLHTAPHHYIKVFCLPLEYLALLLCRIEPHVCVYVCVLVCMGEIEYIDDGGEGSRLYRVGSCVVVFVASVYYSDGGEDFRCCGGGVFFKVFFFSSKRFSCFFYVWLTLPFYPRWYPFLGGFDVRRRPEGQGQQ